MEKIERNSYFINNWRHLFYPLFESVAFPVKLEFSHELNLKKDQNIKEKIYLNDGVLSLLKFYSILAQNRTILNKNFLISAKLAPLVPEKYRAYFDFYQFSNTRNLLQDISQTHAYTYIGLYENQYSLQDFKRSLDIVGHQLHSLTVIHPMFDLENYRSTFKVELDFTQYLIEIEAIKKLYPEVSIELTSFDRFKENYRNYFSYINAGNSIFYYQYSSFDKIEILNGRASTTNYNHFKNNYYKIENTKQCTDYFCEENLSYHGPCILTDEDMNCIESLYHSPLSIKNLDYFYYSDELFNLAQDVFLKLKAFTCDQNNDK